MNDLRDRILWDLQAGHWIEWDPEGGNWVPMQPRTASELAHAGQMVLDLLPNAIPTCTRCGARMDDHMKYETFGLGEIGLICPVPDL